MTFLENENTFSKLELYYKKFEKDKSEKNFKNLCKILEKKKPEIRKLKTHPNFSQKIASIFSQINNYKKQKKYSLKRNPKKMYQTEETENLFINNSQENNSDEILDRIFMISNSTLKNANNVAGMLARDTETLKRCSLKTKNSKGLLKQSQVYLYSIEKAQMIDKFYLYCLILFFAAFDAFIFYRKVF